MSDTELDVSSIDDSIRDHRLAVTIFFQYMNNSWVLPSVKKKKNRCNPVLHFYDWKSMAVTHLIDKFYFD